MGGVVATGVALVLGLVGTILFAVARGPAAGPGRAQRPGRRSTRSVRRSFRHTAPGWPPRPRRCPRHDVADAARQLEAAPEDSARWEWRHLQQPARRQLGGDPVARRGHRHPLRRTRTGSGSWASTPAGLRLTDLEGGEHRTLPIGPEHGHHLFIARPAAGIRVAAWVATTAFDLLDEAGPGALSRGNAPRAKGAVPSLVSPDGTRLVCRPG